MQATPTLAPRRLSRYGRSAGYFLIPPLVGLTLLAILLAVFMTLFRSQSNGRVYDGVSVRGVPVGGLTPAEAEAAIREGIDFHNAASITLRDPGSGQTWLFTPAQLGIFMDAGQTAEAAFDIGRSGGPMQRLQDAFQTWYYGREVAPVVVYDEGRLEQAVGAIASAIEAPPADAAWATDETGAPVYVSAQTGRTIDREHLREQLLLPAAQLQAADVELLVHDIQPTVADNPSAAARLQQLFAEPVNFYFTEPLADSDLTGPAMTPAELAQWVAVDQVAGESGQIEHTLRIDENAVRNWLQQLANQIYRAPVNARYYFNDDTRELVLVAPHVNGRELDIDATLAEFPAQINAGNHAVPLIVTDVTPLAHSDATAVELGITELITETTTWFYGSSDERKHNIARAAANFYGIVIEPGEEFSFNKYLGSVSEADGYEEGLIIVGGRTIKGVGGGVCQVSTTLYQTAFWAGFPIVERWEHGYQVGYYNDGEGPGMDATVYSPIVDLRFINNTPHHLLIENYYNEQFESLTFKFYSTGLGREIIKEEPIYSNIVPAPEEDIWEFDPDLPEGTVEQYDYAADGATVQIKRSVYNAQGGLLEERTFESNYIPWPNVFRYGPGVEPYDYSLVPDN